MKVKIVKVKVNLSEEWSVVHHIHQLLPLIVLLQHHEVSSEKRAVGCLNDGF